MNSPQRTMETTIAAIATPRGHGGVAVVRLSGPQAWSVARRLFSKKETVFAPGRFVHGWIEDPASGEPVDEVLLLVFQAPHSFTGEDVIEIHCHGGDYLSRRILDLCFAQGAEAAGPGEFTRRAFLNGRLDLTQAESVMDLISARGNRMLHTASGNLKNRSLGRCIDALSREIIDMQTPIVASVDFPDEVDEPQRAPLHARCERLLEKTRALEAASKKNRMIRDGLKVAILGMPNSGKSSLFNALLASERAIVTEIPGTTRDVLTETLPVAGVPVTLIDTAGIREADNAVEILGIERSWQAADDAQAVIYVYDATVGLGDEDRRILEKLPHPGRLIAANKIDRLNGSPRSADHLALSAVHGTGIEAVYDWLKTQVDACGPEGDLLDISLNQRQLACIGAVRDNLEQAAETLGQPHLPLDLASLPLTEALRQLDRLMGRDTTEEVLDEVFSRFCVGK